MTLDARCQVITVGPPGNAAGDTYKRLADVQLRLDSKHEAATAFVESAKAFLKVDHKGTSAAHPSSATPHHTAAISALHSAVQLYTDMGRLTMAARQLRVRWVSSRASHGNSEPLQEIAELQEKQDNKEVAIEFYQQAGDLFAGEESTADANKCRLKVAQFSAELGKYPEVRLVYVLMNNHQ